MTLKEKTLIKYSMVEKTNSIKVVKDMVKSKRL